MRVVIDIEANGLYNPTRIWLIVCKNIDTGELHVFREEDHQKFVEFSTGVTLWIGHNLLGYDLPVIRKIFAAELVCGRVLQAPTISEAHILDTLVISKLIDYPRKRHSVADYGEEFGLEKIDFQDFSKYSEEMETYCIRDVEITEKIFKKYKKYIDNVSYHKAIADEHAFEAKGISALQNNGFAFNAEEAQRLLDQVLSELEVVDNNIILEIPPKEIVIREFVPRLTKFGTINKTSVPRALHERIHTFEAGKVYPLTKTVSFNPSSHKQVIDLLTESGWRPVNKTDTHKDIERELQKLKHSREPKEELDLKIKLCEAKYTGLKKYGWKIDEENLSTLPPSAPASARILAQRILLESRRRTLTEWLGLVQTDGRIHGKYYGIGAWTHRMAHQAPNTANIPNEFKVSDGSKILLGKEMRALWRVPKGRLLVGVDAEAIQLRVFAHLINDPVLTDAIVNGNKKKKTDPHSLNQKYFGSYCKTRNAAKHSLYAMFFGGGAGKIAEIMDCKVDEAKQAIQSLIEKYPGLARLQREVFPRDAKRGYFLGLTGAPIRIPGDTVSYRKHLCMSGYLQEGEATAMKLATLKWVDKLKDYDAKLVNFVHDEWQTECPDDMEIAIEIAKMQADSLREVGEELKLNCPLAGSFINDHEEYTISTDWSKTH